MEFSLVCPEDGAVTVGLEDIASIVFNSFESVDVVFVCPECGSEIRVSAKMPNVLITSLDLSEVLERSLEASGEGGFLIISSGEDDDDEFDDEEFETEERHSAMRESLTSDDEARIERYCEYFKRQLRGVDTVEAFLSEVDAK